MTPYGYAKKIGMTRLFIDDVATPVTALQFDENYIIQSKKEEKDGYKSVQVGAFRRNKAKNKAAKGHTSKHASIEVNGFHCIGEFDHQMPEEGKNSFTVEDFEVGQLLDLTALTIGRGFAGGVKRHGFAGQDASHGHQYERTNGSIGSRWPQRTIPGKRMSGRMGGVNRTVKNLKVVAIDTDHNLIFVDGSVPGANTGYVRIKEAVKSKVKQS